MRNRKLAISALSRATTSHSSRRILEDLVTLEMSHLKTSGPWTACTDWTSTNTGKTLGSLTPVPWHWATLFSRTFQVFWPVFSVKSAPYSGINIGSVADGALRPPLYLFASDLTFATNVTVEEFSVWTETGTTVVNKISNIFGTGDDSYGENDGIQTLQSGESPYTYTSTYTITASPTNWQAPSTPTWALPSTGYGSKSDCYVRAAEQKAN